MQYCWYAHQQWKAARQYCSWTKRRDLIRFSSDSLGFNSSGLKWWITWISLYWPTGYPTLVRLSDCKWLGLAGSILVDQLLRQLLWWMLVDNLLKHIQRLTALSARNTPHLLGGGLDQGSRRGGSRASTALGGGAKMRRKSSVKGIIRRTCSIQVEPGDMPGRWSRATCRVGGSASEDK